MTLEGAMNGATSGVPGRQIALHHDRRGGEPLKAAELVAELDEANHYEAGSPCSATSSGVAHRLAFEPAAGDPLGRGGGRCDVDGNRGDGRIGAWSDRTGEDSGRRSKPGGVKRRPDLLRLADILAT